MRCLILAVSATLLAGGAVAQDGFRDSDIRLTRTELTDYLSGQVLEFYDESLATYRADGSYQYNYRPGGPPHPGVYEVTEDSSVCTVFATGFERCDYIVQSGDRHVMIIEKGDRYPIKSRVPDGP